MRASLILFAALALAAGGCNDPAGDDADAPDARDVREDGGGTEADVDETVGHECETAYDCSDGVYCNGVEQCVRGWCVPPEAVACDDGLDCTWDECNEDLKTCVFTPDDARCDDGDPCTGVERCVSTARESGGCVAGRALICDDGQDCTDDYCDSADGACHVRLHDGDGDTHGDRRCFLLDAGGTRIQGDDCNDADPEVHPGRDEICDDGIDNNCDRQLDVHDPLCFGTNDRCDAPVVIDHPGTYLGSTRGFGAEVVTSCGSGADAIFELRLTEPHDVLLSAFGDSETYIAVRDACPGTADLVCAAGQVRARGLAAGTWYVIVKTASFGNFSLTVELFAPAVVEYVTGNDTCVQAHEMVNAAGSTTMYIGSTSGMANDASASCAGSANSPDAVYRLVLDTARSVTFDMRTTSFDNALHVKRDACPGGTEVGCNDDSGSTRRSYLSLSLAPGTYYVFADGFSSSNSGSYELEVTISP